MKLNLMSAKRKKDKRRGRGETHVCQMACFLSIENGASIRSVQQWTSSNATPCRMKLDFDIRPIESLASRTGRLHTLFHYNSPPYVSLSDYCLLVSIPPR